MDLQQFDSYMNESNIRRAEVIAIENRQKVQTGKSFYLLSPLSILLIFFGFGLLFHGPSSCYDTARVPYYSIVERLNCYLLWINGIVVLS